MCQIIMQFERAKVSVVSCPSIHNVISCHHTDKEKQIQEQQAGGKTLHSNDAIKSAPFSHFLFHYSEIEKGASSIFEKVDQGY